MNISSPKRAAAVLATAAMMVALVAPAVVRAEAAGVDPAATQILKQMTDYLGSLKQFSVHTENTLEDLLDSGQRIDIDVSASVTISRPNRLRAERKGDLVSQVFYYNGKTLTLYDPDANVYATEPAPETIEGTLDFARESLGLLIPAADLVYHNAYPLLMQGVTSAIVLNKTVIDGAVCNHLAFSRPDVTFQVWVATGDQPLPCKYVVTDTSTPALISISTVMSEWNVAPAAADDSFNFVPPEGAKAITFMPLDASSGGAKESGASK